MFRCRAQPSQRPLVFLQYGDFIDASHHSEGQKRCQRCCGLSFESLLCSYLRPPDRLLLASSQHQDAFERTLKHYRATNTHTDTHTHTTDVFTSMSIHLPSEKTHTSNRILASKQATDQASKPTSKHAEMSFQQPSEKTEMKSIALKQYHATQMI